MDGQNIECDLPMFSERGDMAHTGLKDCASYNLFYKDTLHTRHFFFQVDTWEVSSNIETAYTTRVYRYITIKHYPLSMVSSDSGIDSDPPLAGHVQVVD